MAMMTPTLPDTIIESIRAMDFCFTFSSLLLYAGLYFAAPLIADYFHEPILVPLSRYSFIGFVVAGFGIAPSAYLFRELKVKISYKTYKKLMSAGDIKSNMLLSGRGTTMSSHLSSIRLRISSNTNYLVTFLCLSHDKILQINNIIAAELFFGCLS